MIALTLIPRAKRTFICDCCGKEIKGRADVCLIRDAEAPPEDPVSHMHCACVSPYTKQKGGAWEIIPLLSPRSALYVW